MYHSNTYTFHVHPHFLQTNMWKNYQRSIDQDVSRLPAELHQSVKTKQNLLYDVVSCYAYKNPALGYVQGMLYILAVILQRYSTFWPAFTTYTNCMKRTSMYSPLVAEYNGTYSSVEKTLEHMELLFPRALLLHCEHRALSSACISVRMLFTSFIICVQHEHRARILKYLYSKTEKSFETFLVAYLRVHFSNCCHWPTSIEESLQQLFDWRPDDYEVKAMLAFVNV